MVVVECFFVFSDRFGQKEGHEMERMLYYWPQGVDPDEQANNMGLCHAVTGFTSTFDSDERFSFIHTARRGIVVFRPEDSIWFCMFVSTGRSSDDVGGKSSSKERARSSTETIMEHTAQQIVSKCYRHFCLFHGSLNDVLSKFSVRALRDKLGEAFDTYLPATSLEQASRIVQLNGLRYLPVDRNSYLRAHCFVNQLEQMFRLMRTSVLLFHDYVVWSGVDQADMLSVYEMIVSTVSSASSMPTRASESSATSSSSTRAGFLVGPDDLTRADAVVNLKPVHLTGVSQELRLVLYEYNKTYIAMFLQASAQLDMAMFQSMKAFIDTHAPPVTQLLEEQLERSRSGASKNEYEYLYFNQMNLAIKNTIRRGGVLPPAIVADIYATHGRFARKEEGLTEVYIQHEEGWVVGRLSGDREFYVVLEKRDVWIEDQLAKLVEQCFGNIFIEFV